MRVRRAMVFNRPLRTGDDTGWFANQDEAGTPYDVSAYDNDGEYFRALGGTAFEENLADLDLYRRSFTLGDDGWLTAELATRDTTGDHYDHEGSAHIDDVRLYVPRS